MKSLFLCLFLVRALPALAQKPLPDLKDGTVIHETSIYRHDGPLRIEGHVRLQGIEIDLRGPITLATGADLALEDVKLRISDPIDSANGASGLRCKGPAKITIRRSRMDPVGNAHPIWVLRGSLIVDGFETVNSEFHLDHVQADLTNLTIFELEISHASQIIGRHLQLVFLSTHTGSDEHLDFSDIPADQPFSRKLRMGSLARADRTDTSAQMFLLYVHGTSDVRLNRIGRAQLAIAPECHGRLTLPHGQVGSMTSPVLVPEPGASDCPFRLHLNTVNVNTWDVYAGGNADLTFTNSVIDELTANGHARLCVRDSEIYADWLSLGGDAQLQVDHSTVGAERLVTERPDLATTQVRLGGRSRATFDHVRFDCGVVAGEDAKLEIHNPAICPKYIRQADRATINTDPSLPVEHSGKEH